MRKLIPLLLILCGVAAGAIAYPRLPHPVSLHWGDFNSEPLPRAFVAFAFPLLAIAVWLLLRALASPAGERAGRRFFPTWFLSERTGTAGVGRFGPTYDSIVLGTVGLLLLFHGAILAAALGAPSWAARVVTIALGVGLIAVGNIMPRTRPNWVAGLRTKRTLADPDVWRRTHRWFGALLVLSGVAVVVASFVAAPIAVVVAVAGALVSAIVATIAGARGSGSSPSGLPAALVFIAMASAMPLSAQSPGRADEVRWFVEQPLDVVSAGLTLPGTLTLPVNATGPVPIAVIVAGSGPLDRNGNGPLVQSDLYAQLAHGLARRGIASVRYDKRGIGEAARTLDHRALTLDDFVNDVATVARTVATDERFSQVFLIGHSEGAGLVLQAANRGAPVAGVAMLAGTGRPLVYVLHDQFAQLVDKETLQRIDSAFARFIRGEEVPDAPEIAGPVLVPHYRRMMASMAAYEPATEIARVPVPVLVVHGGMDLQITDRDAELLRAAQPAAQYLPIPSANHVFKAAASRSPASQQTLYHDRAVPIVAELVEGVASWITSTTIPPRP